MKRVLIPMCMLAIACGKPGKESEPAEEAHTAVVTVSIATATAKTFVETVDAVGTSIVRTGKSASLTAPAAGRITKVLVNVGSKVSAGDHLVEFDRAPFQAAANSADAALTAAQQAADRAKRLADAGVIARKEAETAQAELAKAQADAIAAHRALDLTTIRSPINGVVTRVSSVMGTDVETGAVLVDVADPSAIDVSLVLSIDNARRVHSGQVVRLFEGSDASAEPLATGRVVDIAATIDTASQGVIARVELAPTNGRVRIGETLFGRITVAEHANAVVIPVEALVPDGENFKVFVVDAQDIAHETEVTVAARSDHDAWIKEGIKAGDRVVAQGAYGVSDSSKVTTGKEEK